MTKSISASFFQSSPNFHLLHPLSLSLLPVSWLRLILVEGTSLLLTWIESNPFVPRHRWSVDLVTYLYHFCKAPCKPWRPLPQTGKVYKPLAICTLLLVAMGGALVTVSAPCPMHCSHLTEFIPVGVSQWQWYIPPVILLMYNHSVLSQPTVIFTSIGWGNNKSAIHKLSKRLGQEGGLLGCVGVHGRGILYCG